MKAVLVAFFFLLISTATATAQNACCGTDCCGIKANPPKQVRVSSGVAAAMLLHKEEIVCKQHGMSARVTGTVVVEIEIDRSGKVVFTKAISGPAMLIPPALKAVRSYRYKPYTLNNKPVSVETTVSIPFECPNQ